MRLKTNLIISVIFLALAGFVYFYEVKGGEERHEAAQRASQLADFSDPEARRLTILRDAGTLVLEKQGGAWRITTPVATGVDAAAVERYLRALRESETEGDPVLDSTAVAEDPTRLAQFGLDAPRLRIRLELTDQRAIDTLCFGDDTPTDRYTYVQRRGPDPEVLKVRAWRFDNLDKGLHDLRDRRLLAFEVSQVQRLRLHRPDATDVELERAGGGWRLRVPLARPGDDAAVRRILSSLNSGRTDSVFFEVPSPTDLVAAGLGPDDGPLEVTLWLGEDLAEKRLRLGARRGNGFYARDTSRPQVFLVDSTIVTRVRTPWEELRDKRIIHVEADSVSRVAVRGKGDEFVFVAERDTAGNWSLPDHSDRQVKAWRLNSLLTDLDALRARRWVVDADNLEDLELGPYGLDPASSSVEISLQGGGHLRLRIGRRDGADAYVLNLAVPSVAVVDADDVEGLLPSLDDVAMEAAAATDSGDHADGE